MCAKDFARGKSKAQKSSKKRPNLPKSTKNFNTLHKYWQKVETKMPRDKHVISNFAKGGAELNEKEGGGVTETQGTRILERVM